MDENSIEVSRPEFFGHVNVKGKLNTISPGIAL